MSILFDQSDEYRKEKAVKLQDKGSTKEALLILKEIYNKQEPASHGYAMMAMGLAKGLSVNRELYTGGKVSNAGCYDRYKISRKRE